MSAVIRLLSWPTRALSEVLRDRFDWLRRFDEWANAKERQLRRGRNASLVRALNDAGMHQQAERLDKATR